MKLQFSDLRVGMKVKDNDENIGTILQIKDIHNILVQFDKNSGYAYYCLDINDKKYYDPLFTIK